MGLDMYLYAEKYVGEYDYVNEPSGGVTKQNNPDYDKANLLVSNMPTGEFGGITITKCVAYWRKANAVHGWIVRELADGVDECQRIYMDREDLIRLRDACVEGLVDRDKAKPTNSSTKSFSLDKAKNPEDVLNNLLKAFKTEISNANRVTAVTEGDPIPPTSGFFFGGTEKDEYYYSYLAETAETISAILASDPDGEFTYYYKASW